MKLFTSPDGKGTSPASRLLEQLKKNDKVKSYYLTAEFETGKKKITIRKHHTCHGNAPYESQVQPDITTVDNDGITDEASSQAEAILKSLSLKEGQQILLCVA